MRVPYAWLRELVPVTLPPDQLVHVLTMSGTEVTNVARVDGDVVLDCEITPNRADCLSIIGIAREVAAVTGAKLRLPATSPERSRMGQRPATRHQSGRSLAIHIRDRTGCPQYIGHWLTGVTVRPSPSWMQQRLMACGIRPVNNLVDITNYVLLEWGQPLHAFNWTTIHRGTVIVRRAREGERLRTIDGIERSLEPTMLVIADAERPIALAGIMGGEATAITPQTRELLLESAQFEPRSIRLTARRLGLHSESSYRFERGIDPQGVERASRRAAQLITQLAGGHEVARCFAGTRPRLPRTVVLVPEALSRVIGIPLVAPRMKRALQLLGCTVRQRGPRWVVQAPSHRRDLLQPVDYVEELARLVGYTKIPARAPRPPLTQAVPLVEAGRTLREALRTFLLRTGLQEAVTWSLVPDALLRVGGVSPTTAVRLANPLSQEHAYLRPLLWPRLVEAVATNLHRYVPGVALFEVGNVYTRAEAHCQAELHIAIALTGPWTQHWKEGVREADYFHLKGLLESLSCRWRLPASQFLPQAHPALDPQWSVAWRVQEEPVGWLGVLHPAVLAHFEVKQPIVIAECRVAVLQRQATLTSTYTPLPHVPVVRRDLSLIVAQRHPHAAIAQAIRSAGGPYLTHVHLKDRYTSAPVPAGHVSLTYTLTFQHPARTLTDPEVDQCQQAIAQAVTTNFQATIRTTSATGALPSAREDPERG